MGISKQQALDCLRSPDLIGIGMEADAVRAGLHPEGVVTYTVADLGPETGSEVGLEVTAGTGDLERALEAHRGGRQDLPRTAGLRTGGLRKSVRMAIGVGESLEQRVEDLFAIRETHEETGGLIAFTLSCRQSGLPFGQGQTEAPTAVEYLRTLAVARMVLDNIENVESSCTEHGLKVTQMALRFGANDAGAIPRDGVTAFTEEDLRRVVRDAGFKPVERDALYATMFLGN